MSSAENQARSAHAHLPETRAFRLLFDKQVDLRTVDEILARAAEVGFNVVVVPAFSRGFACFPSRISAAVGLPRRHPFLQGRDCLSGLIDAAARRGLAIYASVSTLNAGPVSRFPRSPFLGRRSEWLLRSRPRRLLGAKRWSGKSETGSQEDSIWLCPVIPAVRQFFASLAAELAAAYPVDGVLLDGLCYPSTSIGDDYCGCRTCVQRTAMELGIHLLEKWPEAGTEAHDRWTAWRAARLTEFLESVKARARKGRRSVRIAGVVGRELDAGRADPTHLATTEWVQEDLLDIFCWHHRPKGAERELPGVRGSDVPPALESPDLWWEEMTVPCGASDWVWPERLRRNRGGFLVRWSGTPTESDWESARQWLAGSVAPLESAPLRSAGLLLNHAGSLGMSGCLELVVIAEAVAERDRETEPAGARLDRLLNLSESLDKVRLHPQFTGDPPPDSAQIEEAVACVTSAAGLVRLAIMSS